MGVLTASAHLQRFTEALLRPFSSSNTFEYEDKQGGICQAFGTAMGYIDDLCIVTFGDEHVHEILLRRVLTAMEKCKLRIQHKKCEFFREQAAFLGQCSLARAFLSRNRSWRQFEIGQRYPISKAFVRSFHCVRTIANL